ncbi:hypothetical protein ACIQD3_19020 [Peribacillus loiseleuriae]|uniref:hypothetical protein n=1 Tax=Peribacillus loiseleuriae TaxID=1679170 RepID=UPI0037FFB9A1
MSDFISPIYNIKGMGPAVNSMFDRFQTAEATPLFNYTSNYGISALRDVITTTGGGAVTNTLGFYQVATSVSANDVAILDTAERGKLFPGISFEAGISFRLSTAPKGTQKATWGYFDGSNGAYFGQDATGVYTAVLNNGVEIFKVYQSSWNEDKLNGNGPSRLTLDTTIGKMYQIRYGYEYGILEFRIVFVNSLNFQQIVVCHRQTLGTNPVLLSDPNQIIRVRVENGGSGGVLSANVRGRYYATLGTTVPTNRIIAERRLNVTANGSSFIPTVSFQRKSTFPDSSGRNNSVNVQIHSFDILASGDVIWELRTGSTLTGAVFGNISETPSNETCCLSDVSATAINMSTGIKLMSGFAKGGQSAALENFPVNIVLNGTTPVTLAVMSLSGNAFVNVIFRIHEDW